MIKSQLFLFIKYLLKRVELSSSSIIISKRLAVWMYSDQIDNRNNMSPRVSLRISSNSEQFTGDTLQTSFFSQFSQTTLSWCFIVVKVSTWQGIASLIRHVLTGDHQDLVLFIYFLYHYCISCQLWYIVIPGLRGVFTTEFIQFNTFFHIHNAIKFICFYIYQSS